MEISRKRFICDECGFYAEVGEIAYILFKQADLSKKEPPTIYVCKKCFSEEGMKKHDKK